MPSAVGISPLMSDELGNAVPAFGWHQPPEFVSLNSAYSAGEMHRAFSQDEHDGQNFGLCRYPAISVHPIRKALCASIEC